MSKPRGLSDNFIAALKSGILKPVLIRVKKDHTLDLQIRHEQVHVYYRGGKILDIKPAQKEAFTFGFDKKYFAGDQAIKTTECLPRTVCSIENSKIWVEQLPNLKQCMDFFLVGIAEKNEREFQQLVIRENNYANLANDTDYFIVDCEYVSPHVDAGKVDLVAFKWDSKGHARQKGQVGLALIEVKYGDNALKNTSGIVSHVKKMSRLVSNPDALNATKSEMLTIFRQKRELELVSGVKKNPNEIKGYFESPPEVMLLLVNHDPAKSVLKTELGKLSDDEKGMLRIASANFFGYGLYEECIFDCNSFFERFKKQLHSKDHVR